MSEKFLPLLRAPEVIDGETKRKVIHALIHEVRITRDGFEMQFYAASDQVKKEERQFQTACSPLKSFTNQPNKNFSVRGSLKDLNGGRSPNLVEPLSEGLDFAQGWVKPRIDFAELAKLRESGLSLQKIAARLGRGRTSVYRALCRYSHARL